MVILVQRLLQSCSISRPRKQKRVCSHVPNSSSGRSHETAVLECHSTHKQEVIDMNSQKTFFNATLLDAQKTITRLWHVRFTRTSSEGTSHGSSSETHREESNTQMHGSICTETKNHLMPSPAETRMPWHKCVFQFIQCFAGPQNVVRVKIEPRFEICWKIHVQTITAPVTWNLHQAMLLLHGTTSHDVSFIHKSLQNQSLLAKL